MKKTLKYQYQFEPVLMHAGAEIVSIGLQNNSIRLWALADPDAELKARDIRAYYTQDTIPEQFYKFHGTLQIRETAYHIFEFRETEGLVQNE